jgi:large subunit ribosomal protein L5
VAETTAVAEKPRLRNHYEEQVRGRLAEVFRFRNTQQVPRLDKIVINVGLGTARMIRSFSSRWPASWR